MTKENDDGYRPILYAITNWVLLVAGIANLIVGTVAGIRGGTALAATTLTAGLVLLFAATIDRFESLKGLGVEAKTKQLDRKIEEADDLLRRLREVGELSGASVASLYARIGRFDSAPSPREAYKLMQDVQASFKGLGSDPGRTQSALEPLALMMCRDLAHTLVRPLQAAADERMRTISEQRDQLGRSNRDNESQRQALLIEIEAYGAYKARIVNLWSEPAAGFSGRLLKLFDDPLVRDLDGVQHGRAKAAQFVGDIDEVISSFKISDIERWIRGVDGSD